MLTVDFLYHINEFVIALVLLAVLIAITEIGYRQGRAASERYEAAGKTQLSTLQGALLGLLALLLAFSFAMAESRFELRRSLVVDESNAIGTAYLRAQMLPEPARTEIIAMLRDYVDARLEYFSAGVKPAQMDQADQRALELQRELWTRTLAVTSQNPSPVPTGLFVSAIGDAMDIYAKRESARENHVPEVVLWLLFSVTIGAMGFVGYVSRVEKTRSVSLTLGIALLLSLVILVIIDLDRPRRGLIEVSQHGMLQLRARMTTSSP